MALSVRKTAHPSDADVAAIRDLIDPAEVPADLGRKIAHNQLDEPVFLASQGNLRGFATKSTVYVGASYRRQSVGTALVEALDAGPLWSVGKASATAGFAKRHGYVPVRALRIMRRSLLDVDEPEFPPGVTVRPFVVGQDEEQWTQVNNRAFAGHPDQGAWGPERIVERAAEPWFDPAGFLLAERADLIIGYHWTKVHGDGLGEVYVIGVDPSAQGERLGAALVLAGLRHLASRDLSTVLLYVDDTNITAKHLYERLGFETEQVEVEWRQTTSSAKRT